MRATLINNIAVDFASLENFPFSWGSVMYFESQSCLFSCWDVGKVRYWLRLKVPSTGYCVFKRSRFNLGENEAKYFHPRYRFHPTTLQRCIKNFCQKFPTIFKSSFSTIHTRAFSNVVYSLTSSFWDCIRFHPSTLQPECFQNDAFSVKSLHLANRFRQRCSIHT